MLRVYTVHQQANKQTINLLVLVAYYLLRAAHSNPFKALFLVRVKRNGSSISADTTSPLIGWSIDTFLQYKYNPCLLRTGTPTPTPTFSPPSFFFYNTGRYETNLRNNRCLYNIQHIHRVAFVFCTNLKYNLELAIGTGLVGRECSNTAWSNC